MLALARRVILLGLCTFAALMSAAHVAYPGGTWFEPHAPRARFWTNYWSDLLQPVALDGSPNPVGARLALAGLVVLAAALVSFWWFVPTAARLSGVGRLLPGVFGTGSGAVLVLLALRVGPKLGALLTAAGLGLVALVSVLVNSWQRAPMRIRVLGVLVSAIVVGVVGLHVEDVLLGANPRPVTPALQKAGTVVLVAWMFELTRSVRGDRGVGDGSERPPGSSRRSS